MVFLGLDDSPSSLAELGRAWGLEHDLEKVLTFAPDPAPAYLLIDTLDTMRCDSERMRMLRRLIESLHAEQGRWCVVAAVRTFDLVHGGSWKALFPGPPKQLGAHTKIAARAIEVPLLLESEVQTVLGQVAGLLESFSQAAPRVQELFRVPFHLRLAAEVEPSGALFASVATRRALFDRYWRHRVVERPERLVWRFGRDVLHSLGTAGHLGVAVTVLDTLELILRGIAACPADDAHEVEEVLRVFIAVATSAIAAGYDRTWRGFVVFGRVVRFVVAEQGGLLADSGTLALVGEIVDAFVNTGWYQAYVLARDLDLSQ